MRETKAEAGERQWGLEALRRMEVRIIELERVRAIAPSTVDVLMDDIGEVREALHRLASLSQKES